MEKLRRGLLENGKALDEWSIAQRRARHRNPKSAHRVVLLPVGLAADRDYQRQREFMTNFANTTYFKVARDLTCATAAFAKAKSSLDQRKRSASQPSNGRFPSLGR
eukprot:TRINITY_DN7902_c0_g1_i2.p1 TRINITY_DN7902_c0_g1~~TRINITY_DN7902_c0_g1_i2.p1  ORF type:complete len:106 (+),score=2.05 TRINITY_DN7902_c0_g1_i2:98-415(+)